MTADKAADALTAGARLVDAQDGAAFAERHVAGSVNIPLEPSFASYVGWLLPFATPLVLSVPDGESGDALDEASMQLRRIGWDSVLGHSRAASTPGPRRVARRLVPICGSSG